MKKSLIFLLMMGIYASIFIHISSAQEQKENKDSRSKQQENKQADTKVCLRLKLKKGFSCCVVYNSEVNITQKGQSDGAGKWKINAKIRLDCNDVDDNGTMTISQSPLNICVEGTDIEGNCTVDFHFAKNNMRIPNMIRGHLPAFLAIKSIKIDSDGKVIAARQSPGLDNYEFMAKGKITYQDNPVWILPDNPEREKKVKIIYKSLMGICHDALGKELIIGKTLTTKLPEGEKGKIIQHLTLKSIQNGHIQLESIGNEDIEQKIPNKFVDEVLHWKISIAVLTEADINTGVIVMSKGVVKSETQTMTFIPALSSRMPTRSSTSMIKYIVNIH